MTRSSFRIAAASSALAAGSLLAACASGPEPSDPHDRLAEAKAALAKPTGSLNATTMKNLASFYGSIQAAAPVFSGVGKVDTSNAACTSGGGSSGAVDLACATKGGASPLTGSMKITAAEVSSTASGTKATIVVDLSHVCSGNVCVDGNMIMESAQTSTGTTLSLAFSADVDAGGKKTHLYFGQQDAVSSTGASTKTVVFDSLGASYVIDASVDAMGAMYLIAGANGSFQCSMTPQGGQCSGAASFNY